MENVWYNKFIRLLKKKAESKPALQYGPIIKYKSTWEKKRHEIKHKMLTALSLGTRFTGEFQFFQVHNVFKNF